MMPFDTSQEIFLSVSVRGGACGLRCFDTANIGKPLQTSEADSNPSFQRLCALRVGRILWQLCCFPSRSKLFRASTLGEAAWISHKQTQALKCSIVVRQAAVSHTVTRTTSSIDVMPCFTLSQPSARKLVMPSFSACCWISRAVLPVAIIDSMVSLTPMTCCTATRPW